MHDAFVFLVSLVNKALSYDPATQNRLLTLAGKAILWRPEATHTDGILLLISASEKTPQLSVQTAKADTQANVSLFGTPSALLGMLLNQEQSPQQVGLRIEGDLRLLNEMKSILSELDIDWEAALASRLGDASAHNIGKILRKQYQHTKTSLQGLPSYIHDFLTEELRSCVSRTELQTFCDDVDILHGDCARLEARIDKLHKNLNPTHKAKK